MLPLRPEEEFFIMSHLSRCLTCHHLDILHQGEDSACRVNCTCRWGEMDHDKKRKEREKEELRGHISKLMKQLEEE